MVLILQSGSALLLAAGDQVINCNRDTGKTEATSLPKIVLPPNLTKGQEEVLKSESKIITCFCASKSGDLFAVSTNNKQVVIYDEKFNVIKNIILNRAASKLCFTQQNDLIVADKTGDAYVFKGDDEGNEGTWILGHNSMLLDVLITNCGKYIITSDRDEKIRVSQFPNCYNIVSYCLGHEEFVTNIYVVGNVLVSASGDGTIRTWDFKEGKQLFKQNTQEYVEDNCAVEKFCKAMDNDNVDIKVLPIRDMQVYHTGSTTNIAVCILNILAIQLYSLVEHKLTFINNVVLKSPLISYNLSDNLYILTNENFYIYDIKSKVREDNSYLDQCYESYKELLHKPFCSSAISVLYKRKFDNVQEYLERKKMRLENK